MVVLVGLLSLEFSLLSGEGGEARLYQIAVRKSSATSQWDKKNGRTKEGQNGPLYRTARENTLKHAEKFSIAAVLAKEFR